MNAQTPDPGRRKALKLLGLSSAAAIVGWPGDADAIAPDTGIRFGNETSKTLRIHPNWYFFTDGSGRAIVLTGSHTWARKREDRKWVADGWNIKKFEKYLDFLEHWNHNYIRLWMWEQKGDVDIWVKGRDGKYDLSQLNEAYFEQRKSFVAAAQARGMYVGVMLFQGWSGCCEASIPDWVRHPMYRDNNVNGIDGDPNGIGYGDQVHSLVNPAIVKFQEAYVLKMIDTLNEFDNLIWEIGNETIKSSIPWKKHMVDFIRKSEAHRSKQHLILDGTGNGVGNDSVWITKPDTFSPCVVTKWASLDDPFIGNPPIPESRLAKPIVLDNDHLGNHFLRFTALDQRRWAWKSFTRGNHPIHMDCYDVFWDGAEPTPDHPIKGVATNPHYDPQRKSLGDVQKFARKMNLAEMKPVDDPAICSTTYCLLREGREYLAYQPDVRDGIVLQLPAGTYRAEAFDTATDERKIFRVTSNGEPREFPKPEMFTEDWILYLLRTDA